MIHGLHALAAWCSIPVRISQMYTGAEEEGLIYSRLCNHYGKCWRGSRLWQVLDFPRKQIRHRGFPLSAIAVLSPQCAASVSSRTVAGVPEGHFSQKGKSLLITAHNSCCISKATGKLSSMFQGLAMWAVKVMRENVQGRRIRINLGNRMQSNSGKSALSIHFLNIFFSSLGNLILQRSCYSRFTLLRGEILQTVNIFHLSLRKPTDDEEGKRGSMLSALPKESGWLCPR